MPDFVSAVENGRVITVTRALAKSAGLTVVNQPATDRNGRPLPPRPVEKSKSSPAPKRAGSARKSSAKKAAKQTGGGAAATSEE